ncbi:hypothetical protein [Frankia tisae]|uniref:hypothetical protein n=1 Tax=Frankia tisae TaxID=2950104 RepID=UPI0021C136D2|nr:hypothetical protein [Frankia tisae]
MPDALPTAIMVSPDAATPTRSAPPTAPGAEPVRPPSPASRDGGRAGDGVLQAVRTRDVIVAVGLEYRELGRLCLADEFGPYLPLLPADRVGPGTVGRPAAMTACAGPDPTGPSAFRP